MGILPLPKKEIEEYYKDYAKLENIYRNQITFGDYIIWRALRERYY